MSRLLTIGEAAEVLGVSVPTLRRWDERCQDLMKIAVSSTVTVVERKALALTLRLWRNWASVKQESSTKLPMRRFG